MECARCVLSSEDNADIRFDSEGVCNHCRWAERQLASLPQTETDRQLAFKNAIDRVKSRGKGRKYDCILGLSGGVDSSYLAYIAKRESLRPLVVHFDNGWNSEIAVQNIQHIVNKLGLDLNTYVIDWDEFKALQLAYLKASVVDIEVLTDHAIYGSLMRLALQNDIGSVLSGNNVATEGVLPYSWTYRKSDHVNIQDIFEKFGTGRLTSYPFLDTRIKRAARRANIEIITLLDYLPYRKDDVKRLLATELGWRDYGGKHYESVFTRFYQGYILPRKFGIDKRKAHLSALICSGQITKEQALDELRNPAYDPATLAADRVYVLKKLGLSDAEFEALMSLSIRSHSEFRAEGASSALRRGIARLMNRFRARYPASRALQHSDVQGASAPSPRSEM